jgi:hypothetical protein
LRRKKGFVASPSVCPAGYSMLQSKSDFKSTPQWLTAMPRGAPLID